MLDKLFESADKLKMTASSQNKPIVKLIIDQVLVPYEKKLQDLEHLFQNKKNSKDIPNVEPKNPKMARNDINLEKSL